VEVTTNAGASVTTPAGTTTITSASDARCTASVSKGAGGPTRTLSAADSNATWAPWSTAQSRAAARSSTRTGPEPDTRTGRIRTSGATPDTPTPSPAPAPTSPAAWVPRPFVSVAPAVHASALPRVARHVAPSSTRGARSALPASTPLSMTATVVPAPRPRRHASGAPMVSSDHCCDRYGSSVSAPWAGSATHASSGTARATRRHHFRLRARCIPRGS
jgi:hypothetical protein